ncbi:MAG: hypothetical protein ACRDZ9_07795 [Acidimicrobiales bacterium]
MGTVANVLLAAAVAYLILRAGFAVLRGLARPLPAPPPPGEVRKVRLRYRCGQCGMELRVERADTEMPDPPRHCLDEMELVTSPE